MIDITNLYNTPFAGHLSIKMWQIMRVCAGNIIRPKAPYHTNIFNVGTGVLDRPQNLTYFAITTLYVETILLIVGRGLAPAV